MKCPKDANTAPHQVGEGCLSTISGNKNRSNGLWYCTRDLSHKGLHHSHSTSARCLKTWTTEEAIIEAL